MAAVGGGAGGEVGKNIAAAKGVNRLFGVIIIASSVPGCGAATWYSASRMRYWRGSVS